MIWSVRPVAVEDLKKIVNIEKNLYPEPWTLEHFHTELDKPHSRGLVMSDDETDEEIAAYLFYWMLADTAEILNVAVDLPYRGLGLAKRLMEHVKRDAIADYMRKVILNVRVSNEAAIHLYQSLQFKVHSRRKAFYSNGEDAYHMELLLDGAPEDI